MTTVAESLREYFDRAPVGSLADAFRAIGLGDVLRAMPVHLQGVSAGTTGACAQQLSTLGTVVLPENAKAAVIHRCTVHANTGSVANGEYTIEAYGTTPATTQVAVAPNGDIVFLGSDGVTSADIIYTPYKGDVLGQPANSKYGVQSVPLTVLSTGQALLPTALQGFTKLLLQANVLTAGSGGVTGQKIILVPAAAAVASTKAALSQDGKSVWFNHATDLALTATVDLLVYTGYGNPQGFDLNALLEAVNGDT
jgi:hypothetical protein